MAVVCLPAFFVVKYIILFFFLPPIPAHKGPTIDSGNKINYPTSDTQYVNDASKALMNIMYGAGKM